MIAGFLRVIAIASGQMLAVALCGCIAGLHPRVHLGGVVHDGEPIMLGKLFEKRPKREGVFAYALLNARIMPDERERRFEQPLIEALARESAGEGPVAEVTGSGTLQDKSGELISCGIDLDLFDLDAAPEFVRAFLTAEGAPKGSRLEYEHQGRKVSLPFGELECLALYLNGTDLPDEVYKSADINHIIADIDESLAPLSGSIWGWWTGPTETALYCYGPSFEGMHAKLLPLFARTPLCERCRVVRIA
jgi:hypothetical protein